MKPHKAFTLAEVLITLGIVGVVAAITIPTLVTNCQKAIAKVRIKKTFATLAQTTYMAEAEHGPVSTWDMLLGTNTWDVAQQFTEDYITPYLRVGFKCKKGNKEKSCDYTMYFLNGQKNTLNRDMLYRFYLVDGTFVSIWALNEENKPNPQKHYKRASILFDVNGPKGANTMGKDIFKLEYILASKSKTADQIGKIAPAWIDESRSSLLSNGTERCNKNKTGEACLALFYKDGWEFAPDYPW